MRQLIRTVAAAAAVLAVPAFLLSGRLDRTHPSSERLLEDIRYLASPSLGGRGAGTPGLAKAANYVAVQFGKSGLKPLGDSGYLQPFSITTDAKASGPNTLEWRYGGAGEKLDRSHEFEPFPFSTSGTVGGSVVFAGYGITACEYGYDDYAGIDVHGKIVLILRHEPQEYDSRSPFEGRVYTEHSQIFRKLLNAKEHGAKAVLLVGDTASHSGPDRLERLSALASPGGADIPFAGVRASTVERWFEIAGRSFADTQTTIDKTLQPESFEFLSDLTVTLTINVSASTKTIANVVGYLPGETSEFVVVGAHYDHLGTGEQFSLAPETKGKVHPGADDNASGTAAVLTLARWFSHEPRMRRGVVFVTFAGEEVGLLGSTWYTSHSPLPLRDAVAMINMDMVGRMRDHSVIVGGVSTGEGLRERVAEAARRFPLELQMGGDAVYGSSDHTAFTAHAIPVLFFFTGLHGDYHRPSDTADKIDARSLAILTELVGSVAASLAQSPERPAFHAITERGKCSEGNITHTAEGTSR